MSINRDIRRSEKEKNKGNLDLLLNDLNKESEKSAEDATTKYEQHKDALTKLSKRDTLSGLTFEEMEVFADIQDSLSTRNKEDGRVEIAVRNCSHALSGVG